MDYNRCQLQTHHCQIDLLNTTDRSATIDLSIIDQLYRVNTIYSGGIVTCSSVIVVIDIV